MKVRLLLLFLLLCSLSQAAVYYVDPSGNNSNNGSSGAPWKTLAYACSKAKTSGDIIHVNSGTYAETSVSYLATGVSIEGEGASSIITSNLSAEFSYTLALNSSEGSNGNQHVSDIKMSGGMVAWAAIAVNGRSNVKIYNCTIENFVAQGVVFNGGTGYMSRAPGTFATGNEFHHNKVTNCARYVAANDNGEGCLMLGGQSGILIYDNTIIQTGRSTGANGYPLKYYSEGHCKGVKIYNNTLTTSPAAGPEPKMSWGFIYESHNSLGGMEFYGNTCKGALDLVLSSKGSYNFAWDIHDNTFGFDTQSPALDSEGDVGIRFEFNVERTNIYRNHFKNLAMAIYVGGNTGQTMKDLYIYNNLFENLGNNLNGRGSAVRFTALPMNDVSNTVTNWNIWNNVIIGGASNSTNYGIQLPYGNASNFSVRNNIIVGFDLGPVQKSAYGTGSNVSIENNIFYNNGNNNDPVGSVSYSNYTYQNNLKVNPLFVSSSDFHVQSSSPAIGKGINVGLDTDYDGNDWNTPPSIGAYEGGSAPPTPVVPVYQSSVVENATPNVIEISYDLSLTNIVPAASAFNVQVNSAARTVSSVSISGGKVRLNLASAVVSGDVVTVSYTKPAANPLQTAAGGQAASLSTKTVTNNCATQIPVYVSSAIQNATPNTLEMTYNLSLASIVPAAAAFSVRVNSVARTVSTVSVSGSKVLLTLSSPVVIGDVVTVAYTKPAANPIQTASGGQAATLSAQTVVNNVSAAIPVYVSSAIQNATPGTLEMTYNLSLASIVPSASAFSVRVNSVARTISTVTVSATKVLLTLSSPVINGDAVTVSYTKPATNPIQTTAGGQAATLSAQTVVNNVSPAIPLYVSSVIQNSTPNTLEMTYNLSLSSIIPAASAFSVLVNSVARTVNSVSVSGTKVLLILSGPVVNGNVITVSYTKPASNPLQTVAGGQAATLTTQSVVNNVSAAIPVYVSSAIQNATPNILEMTYNLSLASIVPASAAFSVRVNSVARTINTISVSGTKVLLTLSSPVINGDVITVSYTKPAANPLQTASGGQAATLTTQSVVNNVSIAIPVYVSSAIQNATPNILEMTYNLSLAGILPSSAAFSIRVNSVARSVSAVSVSGTKVQLTLTYPVIYGDVVTVSYTKPATNPLQTTAGGQAATLSAQSVVNNVSIAIPVYVSSAIQNATPNTLEMTYDLSLASIVPSSAAFSVRVNSVARSVSTVSVSGTKVLLILSSPVLNGDVVTVSYARPSSNPLQTAAGGQAASLGTQTVVNNVITIIPVYVSSAIQNATPNTLEMTYNSSLANIVPSSAAFSVRVNSNVRTVNSVSVSGTKVLLILSSPVIYGDVVTVSYTKPASNPLQTSSGGQAATLSTKTVTNNCAPKIPVFVSSVVENDSPALIEISYDLSLAEIVPAASAFSVLVNSVARAISSVAIVNGKVQLTLSAAAVFGDILTVAYTKPASNPLQTDDGGTAASINGQSVINNCAPPTPVYVSSVIENSAPSILEMTYNLSLANIVPATTAFYVLVNSVARTVNSAEIAGGKVRLTLAGSVVYGDIITVAYSKPVNNPLQTAAGGVAANLFAQSVTNNCAVPVPKYISAVVENATPSFLEMTYDLSLANIVPSVSAFSVRVNYVTRSVSSVAIVNGKVRLTLASPVNPGNVISVSYTKPSGNPLQTVLGGTAVTIRSKSVTNNCVSPIPVYVSSEVDNDTPGIIKMSYDLSLADIVPAVSAFNVEVNSVSRSVSSVAIVEGEVQLTLSGSIVYADIVTIDYTVPSTNPLQSASGIKAESIQSQPVTNNCGVVLPNYVSSIIQNATPAILEMTYSLSLTNIVPESGAFYVLVNSVARTVDSVIIAGVNVQLILEEPVVFGDLVTVTYTKPAINPLQTNSGGVAANIVNQKVTNYCSAPVPTYLSSVVENSTPSFIDLTYDLSLANIVPAASAFKIQVNSVDRTVTSVAITGGKVRLTLAGPVVYADNVSVSYTKPASNPLQTVSGGVAVSVSSKAVTNNLNAPIPVYVSSIVENAAPAIIKMSYDLSLANIVPAASAFSVLVNSVARTINSVAIVGGKVQLTLSTAVVFGDILTVAYVKPASNPLQTAAGGVATAIGAQSVINNCSSPTPLYVRSVIEDANPVILVITYNLGLANIVPATTAFYVLVNSVACSVDSVSIVGENLRLTLEKPVVVGDIVTVTYTKPASNPLQTASGGVASNITRKPVINNCVATAPAYVSSVVENADPSKLEMTYDISLANIVPPTTAFNVVVNSVACIVDSVSIVGETLQLILEKPVVFGDTVTVTYSRPADNPIQTTLGGTALNITGKPVINNCVNNAPAVVITSPDYNSSFLSPANITINVSASDPDGTISVLEFYNGTTLIGTSSETPYSFTWSNVDAGSYSITVNASDNFNTVTTSSPISVYVINYQDFTNEPPVVQISNPRKGNVYDLSSSISIDAIATDPDGTITKVEFYNDTIRLVELTSAPYSYIWKDIAAGTYTLTAIATDNEYAKTVSAPVEFVVGTGAKDDYSEIVNVYPNPNNGQFSIEFSNPAQNENREIIIMDLLGKLVYNKIVPKNEILLHLELTHIRSGMYVMMIKDKEILITKKLIIK